MDEYDLMIPEGYEEKFKKVWKKYDSWKNLHETEVNGLNDDGFPDEDEYKDKDDW